MWEASLNCPVVVTCAFSADKPALDPNTVKMWMLSANDMNDDDLVKYFYLFIYFTFCVSVGYRIYFPPLCRIWWTLMLFWMKRI